MEPTSEAVYERWRQQVQNGASQYQGCLSQQAAANYQQYLQAPLSGIKVPEPPTISTPEIPTMKPLKFIIFYALVAFGTFTWLYNHQEWPEGFISQANRQAGSFLGAAGWPIYWSGRAVFAADDAITAAVPRVTEWWNAPAPDISPMCFNEATGETVRARNGFCRFREKHSEAPSTGGSSGTGITYYSNTTPTILSTSICIQNTCTIGIVPTVPSVP